jgi:hypothetical protein
LRGEAEEGCRGGCRGGEQRRGGGEGQGVNTYNLSQGFGNNSSDDDDDDNINNNNDNNKTKNKKIIFFPHNSFSTPFFSNSKILNW